MKSWAIRIALVGGGIRRADLPVQRLGARARAPLAQDQLIED